MPSNGLLSSVRRGKRNDRSQTTLSPFLKKINVAEERCWVLHVPFGGSNQACFKTLGGRPPPPSLAWTPSGRGEGKLGRPRAIQGQKICAPKPISGPPAWDPRGGGGGCPRPGFRVKQKPGSNSRLEKSCLTSFPGEMVSVLFGSKLFSTIPVISTTDEGVRKTTPLAKGCVPSSTSGEWVSLI